MSLFSRIDRLRGAAPRGDDHDEESVFSIPDLNRPSSPPLDSPLPDDAAPSPKARAVTFQEVAPQPEAAPRSQAPSEAEVAAPRQPPVASRRETPVPLAEAAPKAPEKRLSPLERLARLAAEQEKEKQASPKDEPTPLVPESSLPDPVVAEPKAPSLTERLRAEPLPDVAAPSAALPTERLAARERLASPEPDAAKEQSPSPRATVRSTSLLDSLPTGPAFTSEDAPAEPRKPRESAAERLARDERARTGAFAPDAVQAREAQPEPESPVRAMPASAAPTSATPTATSSGGTAFDRLMAARKSAEADSSKDAPRSSAPSLAERLAAMRAQNQAQDRTEPEPSVEPPSAGAPSPSVEPSPLAVAPEPDAQRLSAGDAASLPVTKESSAFDSQLDRDASPAPVESLIAAQAPAIALPVSTLESDEDEPTALAVPDEASPVEEALPVEEEKPPIELPALGFRPVGAFVADEDKEEEQAAPAFHLEPELPVEEAVAPEVAIEPEPMAFARFEARPTEDVAFQASPGDDDASLAAPPLPWNAPASGDTPKSRLEARLAAAQTPPFVPVDAPPPASAPAPAPAPASASASAPAPAPAPASASAPAPAPVPAPSLWAQRLAGRDALRDASVANPVEPSPTEPSALGESLDRAAGQLARTDGNEGAASEAESRNRALYRQKHFIFDAVLGALDARTLQNATRESVKAPIERAVDAAGREFNLSLDGSDRSWMIEEFVREVTDFGPLVVLLDDVTVNKVLVVGSTDVAVERFGRIERTGVSFRDDDHLLSVVRRIAELTGGRIDAKVPLLDRPLPDGARIRAKIPPLSPQPTLTVEKSTGNPFLALKRQQAERGRENALPYSLLRERIQQRLLREFEGNAAALGNPERLRSQVEEMIGLVIAEEKVAVTRAERASLVMDLLNEIVGLGPIEPLLNDPEVDEVMVNGPFQIYVERKGKLEIAPQRFRDNAHVMQVIERIVAPLGRRVDEKSPMVDGRLRDGSRFNAIIPPLALSGPTMTIRKFARDPFTMTDLINFGSLSREAAQFLQAAVEGRMNIIVSGGTGSGKTTTLNVLSSFIPSSERIVTIEDAAELQLRQEHIVRLETRPANIEGAGEIAIRDLVRNSLRMRPDRIVVGECRGGEALDMLQAMNTGHDGSLTTAHSNGPRDTVKRLETMVMMAGFDLPMRAIREQISMAIQFIVHQERMRDGKRRITAITELVGMESEVVTMQDIFRFEQERVDEEGRIIGALVSTGLRPQNFDNIVDNGGQLGMELFQPRNMGGRDGDLRSRLSEHRAGTR